MDIIWLLWMANYINWSLFLNCPLIPKENSTLLLTFSINTFHASSIINNQNSKTPQTEMISKKKKIFLFLFTA